MTIKEAQEEVDRWIKQYGVRYFSELTNMTVLTEEVGELARVMARPKASRPVRKTISRKRWPMFFGYSSVWPTKQESTLRQHSKRVSQRRPNGTPPDTSTIPN